MVPNVRLKIKADDLTIMANSQETKRDQIMGDYLLLVQARLYLPQTLR